MSSAIKRMYDAVQERTAGRQQQARSTAQSLEQSTLQSRTPAGTLAHQPAAPEDAGYVVTHRDGVIHQFRRTAAGLADPKTNLHLPGSTSPSAQSANLSGGSSSSAVLVPAPKAAVLIAAPIARRLETLGALSLAATAALATPTTARFLEMLAIPSGINATFATPSHIALTWIPVWIALLIAWSALSSSRAERGIQLRGGLLLVTAMGLPFVTLHPVPMTLLWVLYVSAVYPYLLPMGRCRQLSTLALLACTSPLVLQAITAQPTGTSTLLLGMGTPLGAAEVNMVLAGMILVAGLASASAALHGSVSSMSTQLHERVAEVQLAHQMIERLSHHDELTGLPNAQSLARQLDIVFAREPEACAGLLLIEVSHPQIASFAGALREELLTATAHRLRQHAAAFSADAFCARLGDHHFAVLLDRAADEQAPVLAVRLCSELQQSITHAGQRVRLQTRIGVAVRDTELNTPTAIQGAAQLALNSLVETASPAWTVYEPALAMEHNGAPSR